MRENKKNKWKIFVSLLVASAFIMSSASALAGSEKLSVEKVDAGNEQINDIKPEIIKPSEGPISQGDPWIPQVDIVDIKSLCKDGKIPEGIYPMDLVVLSSVPDPVPCKFFVDIYEKIEPDPIMLYCTDFEDNCDIYNNWRTVDVDAAGNGCIDTWTWSDARYHSEGHSFKNTMFDMYKGNQLDYLECTISFDVSWQEEVCVEFWAWVEGDYLYTDGFIDYWDYLFFEIGDDTGLWYLWDLEWDTGGAWQFFEYCIPVSTLAALGLNIHDIMFRFGFESDPEFQYEGVYVDDFCVYSIETYQRKVWQGHSQSEVMVPPCESQWVLPLPWTATEGHYEICAWIICFDPDVFVSTPQDDPYCVQQRVGNQKDAAVIEKILDVDGVIIPCGGVAPAFHDLHIQALVKNLGTVDLKDVIVRASVRRKQWENLFEDDIESGGMQWQHGCFTGGCPDIWHISDFKSFEGDKAWFWADEDMNHYQNDKSNFLATGGTFDLNGALHAYFRFWATWAFAPDADDLWMVEIVDSANTGYHLGGYPSATHPVDPLEYAGCAPSGNWKYLEYVDGDPWCHIEVDMLDLIDAWYIAAPLYGIPFFGWPGPCDYSAGIGFRAESDSSGYVSDCVDYWSGLFVDLCTIDAKFKGELVWEDTVIIPELKYGRPPENVGEEVWVQFEWEQMDFCNYEIDVETMVPDDDHPENDKMENQIEVVTHLETANEKEIESIDYTGVGDSHWVLSSSDYDMYMWCGDPADTTYGLNYNDVLMVAPFGNPAINAMGCAPDTLVMEWDEYMVLATWGTDFDYYVVEVCDDVSTLSPNWQVIFGPQSHYFAGWQHRVANIPSAMFAGGYTSDMGFRFRFVSGDDEVERGLHLDNVKISCGGLTLFFDDFGDCDTPESQIWMNWLAVSVSYGNFWHHCPFETANNGVDTWCLHDEDLLPVFMYPPNINNALIWATEVLNAYVALLTFTHQYSFAPGDVGYLEISANGGLKWTILDMFTGANGAYIGESYDITPWCGQRILIRFRLQALPTGGGHPGWCIYNMAIAGKKDHSTPDSMAALSGTLKESGWYSSSVAITITATDSGSGVKEIHYIVDGTHNVEPGDTVSFTVSANGDHTVEYWSVDNIGNEETPHHFLEFKIDKGSPPTVSITEPTPGIYLFGKKILSSDKIVIFGGFTIEAQASDTDSGVYGVEFFLDGESLGSQTTSPYSIYCGVKHFGDGTIKVVAEDFAQNTAEDELSIKYYKIF
jgi:plastocyanin